MKKYINAAKNYTVVVSEIISAYYRNYKSKFISSLTIGAGTAIFGNELLHSAHLLAAGENLSAKIYVILVISPVLIDFVSFSVNYKRYAFYKSIDQLYRQLKSIQSGGNKFLYSTADSRLDNESTIITNFLGKQSRLFALESIEYARVIYIRILRKVLQPNDYYFSLSNLDFWTATPIAIYSLEQLIGHNIAETRPPKNKYVFRIISVAKELIYEDLSIKNEKRDLFKDLIDKMYDKHMGVRSNHLKTFFLPCESTDLDGLNEIPLTLLISGDLNNLMIAANFNSKNTTETKAPYIRLLYHTMKQRNKNPIKAEHDTLIYMQVLENISGRMTDKDYILDESDIHANVLELDVVLEKFIKRFQLLHKHEIDEIEKDRKLWSISALRTHFDKY